ncbi:MAG: FAD-dependent oxidoreductase, partial [Deltaproteobacteria bacterium]|nr:FAD-dependent oxidoreductase [Deltaproteobacteria bacterium]
MTVKLVIIGGVAGGATAAARARRLDEKAEIILLERGEYISFANCGLPYYIGQVIDDREDLLVTTPEEFSQRYNIDIRVLSEAVSIDRTAKQVEIKNIQTGDVYIERYDKLILSPGAEPVKPPIEGINLDGVFTLRNIPDTDRITTFIDTKNPESAVIVGGGFISLELAENLVHRGIKVIIVEMLNQVMAPLDPEVAKIVHDHLTEKGISCNLNSRVKSISKNDDGLMIATDNGLEIECDFVVLAVGVRPESKLAGDAGISVGESGGILVDKTLRTSDSDILAVGDAIEVIDYVSGSPVMIPLAGPANKQGRIAADNAMGRQSVYKGALGTSASKLFEL